MNADHTVVVHTDDRDLLPELREAYESATCWASKCDLLRLSLLRRHGGWYFDVDFWPLRPLAHAYEAWGIDGKKLFISRQQGHRSGDRLPFANAPMACDPDCHALADLIDRASKIRAASRTTFGPELVKSARAEKPNQFLVSDAGWWFPIPIDQASAVYGDLINAPQTLALADRGTAGQMPFAAHLWASAVDLSRAYNSNTEHKPMASICGCPGKGVVLDALADGFKASGYRVEWFAEAQDLTRTLRRPDVVAIWNDKRHAEQRAAADRIGSHIMVLEHGFFGRGTHAQVDHAGFLHWSSWANSLRNPCPVGGPVRLAKFYKDIAPISARSSGYVLILGQVPGDTQTATSEIPGPAPLMRLLSRALPPGVEGLFRPHPLQTADRSRYANITIASPADERGEYRKNKQGTGLADAIAGARFVVAINSNALNEALAAGVPCMAFGPFLGINAGVVHRATIATLKDDVADMLNGWCPSQSSVTNYLQWLACRQWSLDELRDPKAIALMLDGKPAGDAQEASNV